MSERPGQRASGPSAALQEPPRSAALHGRLSDSRLRALADARAHCRLELRCDALARLGEAVACRSDARVRLELVFGRERGVILVDGAASVDVMPRCQRCVEPYALTLRARIRWALAHGDAEAERICRLHEDREPVLCDNGLNWQQAVEDELLLSLPTQSQHAAAHCDGHLRVTLGAPRAGAAARPAVMDNPFAVLKSEPFFNHAIHEKQ